MHILVAISGGVDSSVVAAMLLEAGHQVTGFTFMVAQDSNLKVASTIKDAQLVAERLGIPLLTSNLAEQFKCQVIEPFINAYTTGVTPNPCTNCNPNFKFKVLLDKAEEIGADAVATGHYAQIVKDENGRAHLKKGADQRRDQSYFLCKLKQEQLIKVLFPLGELEKTFIRQEAQRFDIPVAQKADSQEICFIDDDDYAKFIKDNYAETLKAGNIVDLEGKVLSAHAGIQFYTIGQRKGIGAHTKRKYVIRIDAENNNVVIGDDCDLMSQSLAIEDINWINKPLSFPHQAQAKIRSASPPKDCSIVLEGERYIVEFDEPQRAVTPGQTVAIYNGDELIGGGAIALGSPST